MPEDEEMRWECWACGHELEGVVVSGMHERCEREVREELAEEQRGNREYEEFLGRKWAEDMRRKGC
jgi:hypothetical protein